MSKPHLTFLQIDTQGGFSTRLYAPALIEAPWPEFDVDNARWIIPPERMKMDTPHMVPLSRQSVEVLRALKLLTGDGRLVFPGANDKSRPMSNNMIFVCTVQAWLSGPYERTWIPWAGVDHS
jgi:integrase